MADNYELKLRLFGDAEQLKGMLGIVRAYSGYEKKPAFFRGIGVNDREIDLLDIPEKFLSSGSIVVTGVGPFGAYDKLNDISLFRDLAEAFPKSKFVGEISGNELDETQSLNCELKDGLLRIDTFYESDYESYDAWIDDFMDKLPCDEFQEMFKIVGEDFNEGFYRCFLDEISGVCYDDMSDLDYERFVDCLESIDYETALDEDEFNEIMEGAFSELQIEPLGEFNLTFEGGYANNYVYDPVAKKYVED